jgi:CheY-like chemotaxis protein
MSRKTNVLRGDTVACQNNWLVFCPYSCFNNHLHKQQKRVGTDQNALCQAGTVSDGQKGLMMTRYSVDPERLILELGEIRQKLARLADSGENAAGLSEELGALGVQVEQLMDGLAEGGASPKEGPESKVILVVDDNDELRDFVKQALELSHYNVLDAVDGDEAMKLLKDTKALDLVLCDVVLPGVKGPDLVQQVRDLFPDVKSIFMSGYVSEDIVNQDVEQILATGGLFLQKPFPTRKLLEAVYNMLGV